MADPKKETARGNSTPAPLTPAKREVGVVVVVPQFPIDAMTRTFQSLTRKSSCSRSVVKSILPVNNYIFKRSYDVVVIKCDTSDIMRTQL